MNKTAAQAALFASQLNQGLNNHGPDIVICAPYTSLERLYNALKGTRIMLGCQNMFYEDSGAFTGEISAEMAKEFCSFVIIGHSERRQYFNETDEIVNKKLKKAIEHSLQPIFCIGESIKERQSGKTFEVISRQLRLGLMGIKDIGKVTIAYEPVWAIGTGQTASPSQAEEAHLYIRGCLAKLYSVNNSESARILYGGSANPGNASSLLSCSGIDGFLVGGASLDVGSFLRIINH